MTLFAICPRCDSADHDGPCFMENPVKALAHDALMAERADNMRLRRILHDFRCAHARFAGDDYDDDPQTRELFAHADAAAQEAGILGIEARRVAKPEPQKTGGSGGPEISTLQAFRPWNKK